SKRPMPGERPHRTDRPDPQAPRARRKQGLVLRRHRRTGGDASHAARSLTAGSREPLRHHAVRDRPARTGRPASTHRHFAEDRGCARLRSDGRAAAEERDAVSQTLVERIDWLELKLRPLQRDREDVRSPAEKEAPPRPTPPAERPPIPTRPSRPKREYVPTPPPPAPEPRFRIDPSTLLS